jgi:lipopolysaccharide/colanic/teichoic acid biosynthesis glycosyltransferase
MRIRSPASRAAIRVQFALVDVGLAMVSPFLALYVCHALILASNNSLLIISYWAVSLISSLTAFVAFRIDEAIPQYLSVHDVMAVTKAVALGELLTVGVWFTCTRLEDIPRSAPLVHALILGTGLLAARVLAHAGDVDQPSAARPQPPTCQHIIVIGLNRLSFLYMKFLRACAGTTHQVIAVLDDRPHWLGRSVAGVRVFGPSAHLEPLIKEFAVHGVRIDSVVIGGRSDTLPEEALREVQCVCTRHDIRLVFAPDVFGVGLVEADRAGAQSPDVEASGDPIPADFALPRYFRRKRAIDFCAALLLIVLLSPVLLVVAALAFVDVGSPIFFWQKRTGLHRHDFLLYKVRTLRPAFDWCGRPTPEKPHLSWIGSFLRKMRLDELPQLLSVLVGDMSLIGPRPLLPKDQPLNPTVRLMVRPGITGWAQVNGGTSLSAVEKGELDEWYVRNASLALDLRIVWLTVLVFVRGNRGEKEALGRARAVKIALPEGNDSRPRQTATVREVLGPAPQRQSRSTIASIR